MQYSGPNVRVETVGLLYSIAAQSVMHNVAHDRTKQDRFTQDMIRSSYLGLRLARDLAEHGNDILVWLAYINFQVAAVVEGDASKYSTSRHMSVCLAKYVAGLSLRRRLAELAAEVMSFGLHRETTHTNAKVPLFVVEHRRRIFASTYALDKANATVFSRPPCIPLYFVDCRPPLDMDDEILFASDRDALEEARKNLTADGWDPKGEYHPATWARLRYMIAHFREKVNRYQFRDIQDGEIAELR